jgi:hypothetical protein
MPAYVDHKSGPAPVVVDRSHGVADIGARDAVVCRLAAKESANAALSGFDRWRLRGLVIRKLKESRTRTS